MMHEEKTTAPSVGGVLGGGEVGASLGLLRRLEWRVRHAVENVLGGEYRSAFRGRGMEFDQVVRYEFGDDVRDIDWNVTARLGEPYRKKFVEEREVTVLVVLEDTPSLGFGSGETSKREALLELAGFLMLLGAVNRDRVGTLHLRPDGHTLQPPVRGRGAIHHAAARLFGQAAPGFGAGEAGARREQKGGAKRVEGPEAGRFPVLPPALLPRHSVVVWLGDFAPRPVPEAWAYLQRRYQTMGFRVDDPWERELPEGGAGVVYDPVEGRLLTLGSGREERAAHARWRERREAGFRELFPDPFARLVVGTEENRLEGLVRFFRRRMAR